MERKRYKRVNSKTLFMIGVVFIVFAVFVAFLFSILNSKETRMSVDGGVDSVALLYCKSDTVLEPFFTSLDVTSYSHEIKVTFTNGKPDKISYNYYGKYNDDSAAMSASSALHAEYNIYMGKNNVYQETLYPTFVATGQDLKVNLYADRETLNLVTARLFFLSNDEYNDFYDNSSDSLIKLYTNKGFSCTLSE